MRLLFFAAFLSLVTIAFAWTKEDHEIFDLVSALEAAEGKGTTFYSFLNVSPSASSTDIGKAYRKKSVTMHPDKNRGVKDIEARFARLGVIAKILRNKEDRERYDFFYKNGVPKWRGTGYYYSRFRPGFGTVLIFLTILTSGVQFIIAKYNRTKDLQRIERLVRLGRAAAYGPKGVPIEGKRKVRVPLVGGEGATEEREQASKGKMVDLLVDGSDVYLAGPGHEPVLLDESAAHVPRITDTWAISLGLAAYERFTGAKSELEFEDEINGVDNESEVTRATGNDAARPATKRKSSKKKN